MKRLLLLFLAAALRAGGAEPSTTVRSEGWGVDARTPVFGGGVTVTELPPALRGAASVAVPHTIVGRPVTALEALWQVPDGHAARSLEWHIKRLTRKQKLHLVQNPETSSTLSEEAVPLSPDLKLYL